MKQISFSTKSAQRGMVLIEAMVAILLFSIGVLAVVGLQTTMLQDAGSSKYRTDASYIAQQQLGLMYADLNGTLAGNYNGTVPVSDLPYGKMKISQDVLRGPYRIVITWTQPGDSTEHNYSVLADISPSCYVGIDPGCT